MKASVGAFAGEQIRAGRDQITEIGDLALFVNVVQFGSISRCAASIGFERTTISRRMKRLEDRLGVRLLIRKPRSMTLTEAGMRCFSHCRNMLDEARNARASISSVESPLLAQQTLLIGGSIIAFSHILTDFLDAFRRSHPQIRVERRVISEWDETEARAVHLGVAYSESNLPSEWRQPVGRVREVLVASPAYAKRCSSVSHPRELIAYRLVGSSQLGDTGRLAFQKEGQVFSVDCGPNRTVARTPLDVREAILGGFGFGVLPRFLCDDNLSSGKLIELLPHFQVVGRSLEIIDASSNAGSQAEIRWLRSELESALKSLCVDY
ncbi:MAG: LysR family transcriptional regulator [Woeseiaceae bacterium]|nr:LysR family transcriptional regulator [Woeseiaceae bacterium]